MEVNITHIGQRFLHNGGAEIFLKGLSKLLEKTNVRIKKSICTQEEFYEEDFCKTFPHPVILGREKEIAQAINDGDVLVIWGNLKLNQMKLPKPRLCIFNACVEAPEQLSGCSNYVDHVIACSTRTSKLICNNIANSIILPGIDKSRMIATESREKIRNLLGIKDDDFLVGMIARIDSQKRQDWLIDAMSQIKDKKIKAIFVGDGPNLHSLSQRKVNNCMFVGHKDDIANWWLALDCYCLLSEVEGCPASLFEAMYMRVPVICTNVGSVPDLLTNKEAIIINNKSELVDAIYKIKYQCDLDLESLYKKFLKYGDINQTALSWKMLIKKLYSMKSFI